MASNQLCRYTITDHLLAGKVLVHDKDNRMKPKAMTDDSSTTAAEGNTSKVNPGRFSSIILKGLDWRLTVQVKVGSEVRLLKPKRGRFATERREAKEQYK